MTNSPHMPAYLGALLMVDLSCFYWIGTLDHAVIPLWVPAFFELGIGFNTYLLILSLLRVLRTSQEARR